MITITNLQDGDAEKLLINKGALPAGITASDYDVENGTLTLTGTASAKDYQDALKLVRYNNSSDNPNTTPRSIEITVNDGGNDSNTAVTTVTIIGSNDSASITGDATAAITETNSALSASGTLTVSDPDTGESIFASQTNVAGNNGYGTFTINAAGAWSYAASAHNEFVAGEEYTDSVIVRSIDGTALETITVTITGTNDIAQLSSAVSVLVETDLPLTTSGKLSIDDVDSLETYVAQTNVTGKNGIFSINIAGEWTYTANSAFNNLNTGDSVEDIFKVTATDGATTSVTVTITGTNDAAVITGDTEQEVTPTGNQSKFTATGKLDVTDIDSPQRFLTEVSSHGTYGRLEIEEDGSYTYTASVKQFRYLDKGEEKTETFTVKSVDGTTAKINIIVVGSNDVPWVKPNPVLNFQTRDEKETIDLLENAFDSDLNDQLDVENISYKVGSSDPTTHLSGLTFSDTASSDTLTIDPSKFSISPGKNIQILVEYDVVDSAGASVHQTQTINIVGSKGGKVVKGKYSKADELEVEGKLTAGKGKVSNIQIKDTDSTSNYGKLSIDSDGKYEYKVSEKTISKLGSFDTKTESFEVAYKDSNGKTQIQILEFEIKGNRSTEYATEVEGRGADAHHYSGRGLDGYISQATVFADDNDNLILDAGEAFTTTDAYGAFTLVGGAGKLVMMGGTDVTTGLVNTVVMSAVGGSSVISPVTTLAYHMFNSTELALEEVIAKVAIEFDLAPGIDLSMYDPVQSALAGDTNATKIFAAGVEIQNSIVLMAAVVKNLTGSTMTDATEALFSTLADKIFANTSPESVLDTAADIKALIVNAISSINTEHLNTKIVNAGTLASESINSVINSAADIIVQTNAIIEARASGASGLSVPDILNSIIEVGSAVQGSLTTQITNAVLSGASLPSVSDIDQALADATLSTQKPGYFAAVATDNAINAFEASALEGVIVTGFSPANALITLNIGSKENIPVEADASGSWSYTLTPADVAILGVGPQIITATATVLDADLFFVEEIDLGSKTFIIDLTPPVVTIDGYLPDTGKANDGITNTTSLTLSGTSEANANISILDGATVVATTTVDEDGNWEVEVVGLNHATHQFTAVATDLVGNASSSAAYQVIVDTVAPNVSITGFVDNTGSGSDKITSDNAPTLQGSAEAGTLVNIYQDGVLIGLVTSGSDGEWSFDISSLADQTYRYTTTGTDAAGNVSNPSSGFDIQVDTSAPTATIQMDDTVLKAGESTTVTITFNEAVTGFSNSDVTVENGTLTTLTSSDKITWTGTFTPAVGVNDATNVISLKTSYTDLAGNAGTSAISDNYLIDLIAPTAVITLSDIAIKIGDTSIVTVTFTEPVTGFDRSDLTVANGSVGEMSSSDNGVSWTGLFTPDSAVEDSSNLITLKTSYTDVFGNAGSSANSPNYTIDTLAPSNTISVINLTPDTGLSTSDFITKTSAQTISGSVSSNLASGEVVKISLDGGVVWQIASAASGQKNFTLGGVTLENTGSIIARVDDAAGNPGASSTRSYIVDATSPVIQSGVISNAIDENSGSSQIIYQASSTDASYIGSETTYSLGGTDAAKFSIDSNTGVVRLIANPDYETQASYNFSVVATDVAGNFSSQDLSLSVNNLNEAPTSVITAASYAAIEQTDLALHGTLSIGDVDSESLTVILSVGEGMLTLTAGNSGVTISDSGSSRVTISGTVSQINNLLEGMGTGTILYNDNTDTPSANTTLTLSVNDGFNDAVIDTAIINIAAVNDAAVLSSDTKNLVESNEVLTISGILTISDVDSATTYQAQIISGSYGSLTMTESGAWSYTASTAHNEFVNDISYQDIFTVRSADNTTSTVTINILGTNDLAAVSSETVNVTEGNDKADLNTSGKLTIADPDTGEAYAIAQTNVSGTYGTFNVATDGAWTFAGNGANNELTAGQVVTQQLIVRSQDGSASGTITVRITGTNDLATVSSETMNVTEGDAISALNTSGKLTIADPDTGEAYAIAQTNVSGTYGTFNVATDGAWTFTGNGAHNELTAGQVVTQQLIVQSQDGSASGTITVRITGTNDLATVSSETMNVTEGDAISALNTSGKLTIADPDTGEAYAIAQTNVSGTYGTFNVATDGAWTFTGNGAHNELTAGQVVTQQLTVQSQDGSASGTITVRITGTNDLATVSSTTIDVTEGNASSALNTSGKLTIADPDTGEAYAIAQTNVSGTYGTFNVATDGAWTFTGNGAHNELTAGQVVTQQLTVQSQEGSGSGTITVRITGTNDAAVLSSETQSLIESNEVLTSSGILTISDVDSATTYQAQIISGSYGSLTMTESGAWSYTASTAHNEFVNDISYQDIFTVRSADNTTSTVTINILGTNDLAAVSSETVNVTEGNDKADLNTSGKLTIADPDTGEAYAIAQTNVSGTYGTFNVATDGAWTFAGNGANNELTAGQVVTQQLIVRSQDGSASGTITVRITGTNDLATVSSETMNVTEGDAISALNTSGKLTIADPDTGEAYAIAQTNVSGTYGTFNVATDGAWTFTGNGAHNELTAGQVVTQQLIVQSQDGSASGTITVRITGTNDLATVSSETMNVTEGDAISALNTSGKLTIADPDTGEAYAIAQTNVSGTYGTFNVATDGAWTFTGNGAHNELTAGQVVTQQLTVQSQDGSASGTITVRITGTNDLATVSSTTIDVTEGNDKADLNTSGKLTIADPDTGEAYAIAQTNVSGTYGTFDVATDGAWTFTGNGAHNELTAGQVVTQQLTVRSQDGSGSGTITVRITGTNDAAVITGTTTGSLREDGPSQSLSGTLSATDSDSAATFVAPNASALQGIYGSFTFAEATGQWTYTLDNSSAAVQSLTLNQIEQDTLTVHTADGTSKAITVSITGAGELAPQLDLSTVDSALAQSTKITFASAYDVGDQISLTIDGNTYSHTVATGATTAESVYDALRDKTPVGGGSTKLVDSLSSKGVAWEPDLTSSNTVTLTGNVGATFEVDSVIINTATRPWIYSVDFVEGLSWFSFNSDNDSITIALNDTNIGATNIESAATSWWNAENNFDRTATFLADKINTGDYGATAEYDAVSNTFTISTNASSTISGSSTSSDAGPKAAVIIQEGTSSITQGNLQIETLEIAANAPTGYAATFTELAGTDTGTNTVAIVNANLSIADADSTTLQSAQITLTNHPNGAAEKLVLVGSLPTGLSVSAYDSVSGVLRLTGEASLEDYRIALQAIGYSNTSDTPDTSDRIIEIVVSDGGVTSNLTISTISINATNDASVIGGASTASLTETNDAQTATGTLTSTDVDGTNNLFTALASTAGNNGYGKFSMTTGGAWTYIMDNAQDQFKAGTNYTDSVTVTAADGTAQIITITITGSNDAAVIGGVSTASLTETNDAKTATGTLTSIDVDGTDNLFTALASTAGSNGYGKFSMTTGGAWTYIMDNAHNEFEQGINYTDSVTVTAADGTAQIITVTIAGSNDAAVISGASTASLTETNEALTATGTLTSTDVDGTNNLFTALASTAGTNGYGKFSMTSGGAWSYIMDNAHNEFEQDTNYTDSVTVTAADGTAQIITVTIAGSNDAAVISGVSTASLTETNEALTATGTLTSIDVDGTNNLFTALASTAGNNGYGKFSMTTGGAWTYTLNNAQDQFKAGINYTDSVTVTAADGTAQIITVTIAGSNDAAVISGASTASLTETNEALTATGTLTSTDVDGTNNLFTALASTAGNNGYGQFSMTTGGAWTYTLNNAQDQFKAGINYTDSVTVTAADGTAQIITVTIAGSNDAAVISGTNTGNAIEAGGALNATTGTPTATGTLSAADVDSATTFTAVASAISANGYGTYAMTTAGVWTYTLINTNSAVQALNANTSLSDSFTVTTADGTTKVVTINIDGTNDAAIISGASTASLTETNDVQTAIGTLTSIDVDGTNNLFTALASTAGTNGYGKFSMTTGGAWAYTLNNAQDQFKAGINYTDSVTVTAADGTAQIITVTIAGSNDAAVISGASTASLTETNAVQTATGTLTSTDVDGTNNLFTALASTAGTNGYGKFSMTTGGAWTYIMDNAQDQFKAGINYTDSVTVTAADGTAQIITVTITGSNDAAVISGVSTASLTETNDAQTATGTLTSSDVDGTNNLFTALASTAGTNGYGKFSMTTGGAWTYIMDNAHNEFEQGINYTDSVTVTAADGTAQIITVTIAGSNDAAIISGASTASLTETNDAQTATGTLTSTDVDGTNNLFTALSSTAGTNGYGKFSMTTSGAWTYIMDNAQDQFKAGINYTDSVTVTAADGTTQIITVTINGTNDVAIIGGVSTGVVTEDSSVVSGNLQTGGKLTITDADQGQSTFTPQANTPATYGSFTLDAQGNWTYSANNSQTAIQQLGATQSLQDRFTAVALDGTTQIVTVTINGTNDTPTGVVTITGEAKQGETLTASNTLADIDGLGVIAYQWQAAGSNIADATASTYTLTQAEVGKVITVIASYTDAGSTPESVASAPTVAVANINDAPTGVVTITGEAKQGETLTASNTLADIDGLGVIAYQWQAAGSNIADATASTYPLTQAEVGKVITVIASYTDAGSTPESVASAPTVAVANINDAPVTAGPVTLTAIAEDSGARIITATQLLANTSDPEGNALTVSNLAISSGQGSLVNNNNGTWSYTPVADDDTSVGFSYTITDNGSTNGVADPKAVSTSATLDITPVNDAPVGDVVISGTVSRGETLTAIVMITDADGLGEMSYQWQVDGVNIIAASSDTFTLTEAEIGKEISVIASYTDRNGTLESVFSELTEKVSDQLNVLSPKIDLDASDRGQSKSYSITFQPSYDVGDKISLAVDEYIFTYEISKVSTYNLQRNNSSEKVYDFLKTATDESGSITLENYLTSKGVTMPANLSSNQVVLTGAESVDFVVSSSIVNTPKWIYTVDFTNTPSGFPRGGGENIYFKINGINSTLTTSGQDGKVSDDARFDIVAELQRDSIYKNNSSVNEIEYDRSTNTFTITGNLELEISATTTASPSTVTIVADSRNGTIIDVQSAPAVQLLSDATDKPTGYQTGFTEMIGDDTRANAIKISSTNLTIEDGDSLNIESATVTLTNRPDGSDEILFINGVLPSGIVVSEFNSETGELILSGTASLASYRSAISLINYNNASNNPDESDRRIEVVLNDGSNDSNIAITTIVVNSLNEIFGTNASDTLIGSASSDAIIGGLGADILWGKDGADTFVINASESYAQVGGSNASNTIVGYDIIKDFNVGVDTIDLVGNVSVSTAMTSNDSNLFVSGSIKLQSHFISNGIISFDDQSSYSSPYTLDSLSKVAVAVEYLQRNTIGGTNSSSNGTNKVLAFKAAIAGVEHTYIYQQLNNLLPGTGAGNSSKSLLVDLEGVTLTNLTTLIGNRVKPITFDLNGDGVQYQSLAAGIAYDYGGNGSVSPTAWVASSDGLLAVKQANGSLGISFATQAGETDLQGLAKTYDANRDNIFNAQDAGFDRFGVWQDVNSDGATQEGEFKYLTELGIVSLSLTADGIVHAAADGDVTIFGRTTYTMADGSTRIAEDVAFVTGEALANDGNGVQDIQAISAAETGVTELSDLSLVDSDRIDLSGILNPSVDVPSAIPAEQNDNSESQSTFIINIGGVEYEVASAYGKELGAPDDVASSHTAMMPLVDALPSANWTDIVDVASPGGAPASISTIDHAKETGDWTVQIESDTTAINEANKQVDSLTSNSDDNSAGITSNPPSPSDNDHIDKINWN